jgi:hypothetical protein
MGWFRHLPTTSQQDVTANFEQLQPVIEALTEDVPEGKTQVTVGGIAVVEWAVKGRQTAEVKVTTGLGVIVSAVANYLAGPAVTGSVTSIAGGVIGIKAYDNEGEVEKGTLRNVSWIAIGYV